MSSPYATQGSSKTYGDCFAIHSFITRYIEGRFSSGFLFLFVFVGVLKNDMQLDQKALAEKYYTELDIDDMEIDVRLATPWLGTLPLVPRDMKIR